MKTLLTASRMSAILRCPRFHYWRYETGLARTDADALPLLVGSAWHRAMEARWHGATLDDAYAAALAGCALDAVTVAIVGGLLAGYYAHYADEPLLSVRSEVEFRMPIHGARAFDAAGKIDGLAVLADGRRALLEHKTAGEAIDPAAEYWLRLRADKQLYQYILAARALGHDPAVCIYDVTRKPCIKVKQGETPEEFGQRLAADTQTRPEFYFARREIPIIEGDLVAFQIERAAIKDMILALRAAGRRAADPADAWPRNVSSRVCSTCEYSGFCLAGVRVDAANLPPGFRIGPANPELSAAPAE